MNKPPTWLLTLLHAAAIAGAAYGTYRWRCEVGTKYSSLRPGLFSGFLTMTGFAMTMKAYVMANVAKAVHESKQAKAVNETLALYGIDNDLYKPLEELRDFLVLPVVMCLSSAIAQVTFGLRDSSPLFIGIALCVAASAVASIIGAIWMMRYAMCAWIEILRNDNRNKGESGMASGE